jgi:histidinol dehydrogenase
MATCAILGVDEVYAVGGAQAIAMFAYGARGSEPQDGEILCDPVDKITGPGNIFVATAKSMVSGMVGIDAVAGPTEIAILADEDANPSWVAADLIGQAEHDELAGSVLITDSEKLALAVQVNLDKRVPRTEHAERVQTSLTGRQSGIILTDGLDQSIAAANAYAAEHLEIQTADPDDVVPRIKNAGAIFRGPYSPVPLGDYMSGSNHVLPTGGTARFDSGLGVHTFMKAVEVIEYDEQGLKELAARINTFAVSEDLPAHGECVLSRFIDDPYDKATITAQEEEAGLR